MTNRRQFLKSNLYSLGGVFTAGLFVPSQNQSTIAMESIDPIKAELVKEFVAKAHADFDRVKEMLALEPKLLNATQDWGGGDYETALGAAGHMGRKDIAEYLLAQGARMDIFCAAMLGKLDIVKATLEAYPHLKTSKGPHGLMLVHHAQKGGDEAKLVLEYLMRIGAS